VREHSGAIVAANNDRGGATFSVELPAALRPDDPTHVGGPAAPAYGSIGSGGLPGPAGSIGSAQAPAIGAS